MPVAQRVSNPTLVDVAREAGVAPITASRVFSGGSVAPATRERVQKAAQRLRYRPNHVARSLVQARTRTVGLVMPRDHHFRRALIGAEEVAQELGYTFLYTTPSPEDAVERERIDVLVQRRVDGLLLLSSSSVRKHEHLRGLHQDGVPLVTINRYCEPMGFWRIFFDYRGAARSIVRRWLAAGRRQIACVGGAPEHRIQGFGERIEGYREALREAGLWVADREAFGGMYPREGEALTETLLARAPATDAIVAVTDLIAAGVLRALRRLGRRVPEDVAVIGFDNTDVAFSADPPLTSVRHSDREAGRTGFRLLVEQIEGRGEAAGTIVLPATLALRRSCGLSGQEGEMLPLD